ncbi:uncharacterized protein LOC123296592 isoform X2 [Chrysoperla carnea]|uniref:uncharacterized protein LOC123296592 isoform X2 n=1 Tax=Chrysoperla carnea TaxID=189513 RepID=UPI001D0923EB|nr:uncharacterized protein LOC123296592 isoform X2 [Chrysoperla carnea]
MPSTESCQPPDGCDQDENLSCCEPARNTRSNYCPPPNRRRRACPANERGGNRTLCQIVERYLKDPFIVFFLAVIGIKICNFCCTRLEWRKK